LLGRTGELEVLDQLIVNVRSGQSAVLVVRGEPGIGKTAVLRHLIGQASGFRVIRATGVESEMELPFAGLHQLCAPMLGQLGSLAEPQRHGVSVAFGLASGHNPDRFLVGLGALGLMAETSEEQPLLCVVDDAHWLDQASAQVLGFVARRLLAESIALVFAARTPAQGPQGSQGVTSPDHLAGLPELGLGGLDEESARALLATITSGPLDESVRDRIIEETRGNPLALLQQGIEVGGEGVVVIPGCRLAGLAEPAPVVGDDPVPGRQQGRDLLVPGAAAERVAVDQHDRLAGAMILVVDLDGGVVFLADGDCGHEASFR
jgi:AAA ATPase domain